MSTEGKVLDLVPVLRRKRAAACKHLKVSVDDHAASITCDDCGAELDPWLLLRQLAHHRDEFESRLDHDIQAKIDEGNAKIAQINRRLAYYTDEINELLERRNRLWHEQIDGRPLGTYRKTRARKRPESTS